MLVYPVFLGFVRLPDGDEHPIGDVDKIDSILLFLGFLNDSNRGKWNACVYGLLRIRNCCKYVVNGYKLGEMV